MPMNTAGFDCRAPRIMGDWMVGLPSVRKLVQLATLVGRDGAVRRLRCLTWTRHPPVFGSLKHRATTTIRSRTSKFRPTARCTRRRSRMRARGWSNTTRAFATSTARTSSAPTSSIPSFRSSHPEYPYHPNPYEYQHDDSGIRRRCRAIRCIRTDFFSPASAFRSTRTGSTTTRPNRRRRGSRGGRTGRRFSSVARSTHGVPIGMKSPEQLEADGSPDRRRRVPAPARLCRAGAR